MHFIQANNLNQSSLYEIIARNVDKSVEVIMTDESRLYNFKMTQFQKAKHKKVNHSQDEYVRREKGMVVTTNTVESAFSLLKRGIVGRGIGQHQTFSGLPARDDMEIQQP